MPIYRALSPLVPSVAILLVLAQCTALYGEDFPATVEVDGIELRQNGVGLCEWGVFGINLYKAALWVEVPASDPDRLLEANPAKQLELLFCRKLSEKQMRKAYKSSFKANATDEEKEKYAAEIEQFLAALGAVKKNERLTMSHAPGQGIVLTTGEETTGPLGDDGFATLLFRLYLGEKPPTKQLRRQLLGKHPRAESLTLPREAPSDEAEKKKKKKPESS